MYEDGDMDGSIEMDTEHHMEVEENNEYVAHPTDTRTIYEYPHSGVLRQFQPDEFTDKNLHTFYICVYKIHLGGKYPFVEFLLEKDNYSTVRTGKSDVKWNWIKIEGCLFRNIVAYAKVYLVNLLGTEQFEVFDHHLFFRGLLTDHEKVFLFFDISKICDAVLTKHHKKEPNQNHEFVLMDEIMNGGRLLNGTIQDKVSSLFLSYPKLIYIWKVSAELGEKHRSQVEVPIVAYQFHATRAEYVRIFGSPQKNRGAILGPYYYFTNYGNAIRRMKACGGERVGGLVRFALFMGTTKYIENGIQDEEDTSHLREVWAKSLPTLNEQRQFSLLTRITDFDGVWTTHYDSVLLGKTMLDDGEYYRQEPTPLYVVKSTSQQVPLNVVKGCI